MLQVRFSGFKLSAFTTQGFLPRDISAETSLCFVCVCWGQEQACGHVRAHIHTRSGAHTHALYTRAQDTDAHSLMDPHVCTQGCMCTHSAGARTRARTLAQLKPQEHSRQGRVSAIQFISLPFSEKSLKTSRITPSGPRWLGGAT